MVVCYKSIKSQFVKHTTITSKRLWRLCYYNVSWISTFLTHIIVIDWMYNENHKTIHILWYMLDLFPSTFFSIYLYAHTYVRLLVIAEYNQGLLWKSVKVLRLSTTSHKANLICTKRRYIEEKTKSRKAVTNLNDD